MSDKNTIINQLELEAHPIEGGYFRRTYESDIAVEVNDHRRKLLTSIYYLLTDDSPIGYLHKNKSDIVHYFHSGAPMNYLLVSPSGECMTKVLGNDLECGQRPQLLVPGGLWKASWIDEGEDHSLISEAVSPGFEYSDNILAATSDLQGIPEDSIQRILPYLKESLA